MRRYYIGLAAGVLFSLLFPGYQSSAGVDRPDRDCLDCHADPELTTTNAAGRIVSLHVDESRLRVSVHKTNSCVSCHTGVTLRHPEDGEPVGPVTCESCHQPQSALFNASVHAQALHAGQAGAATCQDCHGTHDVQFVHNPDSPLHFTRQAQTCGACHEAVATEYQDSIHGRALAHGIREAPTCTDCHSEHRIEALRIASPAKIARDVCSRCHASERINTKFRLPGDRVETFFLSYHGLAAQYGLPVAANCGSCHGTHNVLPSSDARSTIHPDNLIHTCGRCHPGATEKFVRAPVHIDVRGVRGGPDPGSRINWYVRRVYWCLITVTVGFMLIHNGLMFRRKLLRHLSSQPRTVLRMNAIQRWQHHLLAFSFLVLAITGFALSYPDSWLARLLGNSEPFRRWLHRWAGVVLLLTGLWHLLYVLLTSEGRKLARDLLPRAGDGKILYQTVAWLLGRRPKRPPVGRFSYVEKLEYWAVTWGTLLMGITGLMIWFKLEITRWLPRWIIDVALTVHFYEAILACLAIVAWHFYHVIFDPDVYPLNPACWDGRVTEGWYREEHPLDSPPYANSAREHSTLSSHTPAEPNDGPQTPGPTSPPPA
ncbi:MAG: cytochrome b/b6 domain-containing protein [Verrucomicrobiota bacterium]|nr:cytochrome b/b6 domain-containing protein [Limisphaera sp.]MDW8382001.1 cytochrome b/b6 domain-containing protein [Verrucomicrobiota bacterium]